MGYSSLLCYVDVVYGICTHLFHKFTTLWAIELCCDMLMLYIVYVPDFKQVHKLFRIEYMQLFK